MQSARSIPAVETVLQALGRSELPRPVVVAVVRRELAALRKRLTQPREARVPKTEFDALLARIRTALDQLHRSRLQPVINGTGVIIHTNLGRAPLAPSAVEALANVAANYNNLELDLVTGERGGRAAYLEHNLALLCGAEAATVVNNCAAALVLILRHFTAGARKQVVISRGELIQIGGGFRIPDILESSGARLREVGTTNKTSLSDYARALGRETALILKVHRSNFFMGGFVESPSTEDLAALARKRRVPFVEDLGSGAVVATEDFGVDEHEPTAAGVLKRGVDLVCFSGDKLLGGPQAGIIAGKAKLVTALKREPFFRALRCDKLVFAALQATADLYLAGRSPARQGGGHALVGGASVLSSPDIPRGAGEARARQSLAPPRKGEPSSDLRSTDEPLVPVLCLLKTSIEELRARAEKLVAALAGLPLQASVGAGQAQVGGGTLPKAAIASVTVELRPRELALADFAARLRAGSPPVIGYVAGGRFKLDLRTVFPHQDEALAGAIRAATAGGFAQSPT